jgi:predicted nucleic-acid-binding Zn-ribbon protein
MDERVSLRSGKCPICGSDEVYNDSNVFVDEGKVLSLSGRTYKMRLTHYLCADCGYVETYMNDENDREKASDYWKPSPYKNKRKNDE